LQKRFSYPYLLAAACFVLFAFGSKGVTGLFPLSSIFLYYFCFRKSEKAISFKHTLAYSALLSLTFWGLFGAILWLIPNAYRYFNDYMSIQVVNSIENVKTVSSHWSILLFTLEHLSTMLILVLLVGVGFYYRNAKQPFIQNLHFAKPEILWTFAIALSAVLPITVSQKQSDFYALGCYPFFAVSCGLWLAPAFLYAQERLETKKFWHYMPLINSALLLAGVLLVFPYIGITRSQEKAGIDDVALLAKYAPRTEVIGMCYEVRSDWTFSCYAMRYHYLELDIVPERVHTYYILAKNGGELPKTAVYEQLPIDFQTIRLYKLKE
jgi:hypothetical protein